MRPATKRLVLKAGALLLPFALLFLLLALLSGRLTRFFNEIFSGSKGHDYGAFTVYTPAGAGDHAFAGDVAREFTSNLLSRYGEAFHLRAPTGRINIYLLHSEEELQKYGLQRFNRDLANNGGFFNPAKREIALVVFGKKDLDSRGIRHEIMHALMHEARPEGWPSWLSEGMASYFEHSRAIDGVWTAGGSTGDRPRLKSLLPLARLREAGSGDFTGRDNALFYRSSHLLVAYLFERRGAEFLDYYRRVRLGEGGDSFRKSFGPPEEVESAWKGYVAKLS